MTRSRTPAKGSTISASRGHSNGVVEVAHLQQGGVTSKGDMIVTPATLVSQRAEPSPLWSGTFPKPRIRHGTTRISRVGCRKADRGCASRVPLPPGVTARRTGGMLVVRATLIFGAGAPPGRVRGDKENDTLTLPFLGSLSPQ